MIIDNVALNGSRAYLQDWPTQGPIDLSKAPHKGQTPQLFDGQVLETTAIDLHIETDDLDAFMAPAEQPIVTFRIRKELFPGLYLDPFEVRAHNIAGFDDFRQGDLARMRVMMVDDIPTLVSDGHPGTKALWTSPLYRLTQPMYFMAAAWEPATSRLTPKGAFEYSLRVLWWPKGTDPEDPGASKIAILAEGADPQDPTHTTDIGGEPPKDAIAYRVAFEAAVVHDASLMEFEVGGEHEGTIGRPLLRAVNLLESVEPGNRYTSLHELAAEAEDFVVFPEPEGPRKRMFVTVPMSASLTEGEWIAIELDPAFSGALKHMTARVQARLFARPAEAGRLGG